MADWSAGPSLLCPSDRGDIDTLVLNLLVTYHAKPSASSRIHYLSGPGLLYVVPPGRQNPLVLLRVLQTRVLGTLVLLLDPPFVVVTYLLVGPPSSLPTPSNSIEVLLLTGMNLSVACCWLTLTLSGWVRSFTWEGDVLCLAGHLDLTLRCAPDATLASLDLDLYVALAGID